MKAFKCFPVAVNSEPKWVLRAVEDSGDWKDVPGIPAYPTQAECDVMRQRLDVTENGEA